MNRKLAGAMVGGTAVVATLLATTSPAYAAGPGGVEACPNGSFCLYYNSPGAGWGSFEHWSPGSYSDLNGFYFRDYGNGSGYNKPVWENAASAVNNTGYSWNVCVPAPPPDDLNCGIPIAPQYAGRLPDVAYNKVVAMFIN